MLDVQNFDAASIASSLASAAAAQVPSQPQTPQWGRWPALSDSLVKDEQWEQGRRASVASQGLEFIINSMWQHPQPS